MKALLTSILTNLIQIQFGTMNEKIFAILKIAVLPTIGISFAEKITGWYFENFVFIALLIGAWIGDLVIGVWKHYKMDSISPKKMIFHWKNGNIL